MSLATRRSLLDVVPPGAVLGYVGGFGNIPPKWLACDGSEVSKTQYNDLWNVIGNTFGTASSSSYFRLPDLRYQFVRGSHPTNYAVGSSQTDSVKKHKHNLTMDFAGKHNHSMDTAGRHIHNISTNATAVSGANRQYSPNGNQGIFPQTINTATVSMGYAGSHVHNIHSAGSHVHTINMGNYGNTSETRPQNVSLTYIIKT